MLHTFPIAATRPVRRAPRMPMRDRVAAGVAALALSMMTNPASAKTVFPIEGGSGNAGFEDHCPPNEYVTGLAGRSGLWIDQVRIICSPVLSDGTHGPSYYGPLHGGTGGAALEFSCATDSFVTGAKFFFDDENSRVTRVDLTCTSMQASRRAIVTFGGGEPSATLNLTNPEPCPNDEFASGFAGRYGRDVNAMGLLCDARITATVPAPAPSYYPIRQTGKAASPPANVAALACPQGFVWREASPTDHVCVTPLQRSITAEENAAAAGHIDPSNRTYGPNTCAPGYVWREAYSGDVVCVTPQQRANAAEQKRIAPALIPAGPL